MSAAPRAFFVGYSKDVPQSLKIFALKIGLGFVGFTMLAALLLSLTLRDGGDGVYANDGAEVTLQGLMVQNPVPMLLQQSTDSAHVFLLAGDGKRGVVAMAQNLVGQEVSIKGVVLKRGDIAMLVTSDDNIAPLATNSIATPPQDIKSSGKFLGHYKMAGEICDGKCNLGAMHPSNGLAHKACANLCLQGGVPPIFVSAAPLDNHQFFVLANAAAQTLPKNFYDLVALPVQLEGDVFIAGGVLFFYADFTRVKFL